MSNDVPGLDNFWAPLAYDRHDLRSCAGEAIQFCGAIQAGGHFLRCDPEHGLIDAVSLNCVELFGVESTADILGQSVFKFLKPDGLTATTIAAVEDLSYAGAVRVRVRAGHSQHAHHASFYRVHGMTCVDVEPLMFSGEDAPVRYVDELRRLVHQVDSETEMPMILDRAASQVRKLTGFDRVMIYRFEANWDGMVVAENRAEYLDPFLGLVYPESDIPPQARQLFMEQRYRMIISTQRPPVPIVTRAGLGRSEIDLGNSALRAVSPIHIQYLRNMGVHASFSVPIRVHGRLWGLIACHHNAGSVHLPREIRSSCELAAQVLSGRLADHINDRRLRLRNRVYEFSQNLLSVISDGGAAVNAFASEGDELLDLTHATGAFVRMAGEDLHLGNTPSPAVIAALVAHLNAVQGVSIWSSRDLRQEIPNLSLTPEAVGALAVPLSFGFDDLFIWFRPEAVEEIHWGGKPDPKAANLALEPRASFAAWTEVVRGKSRAWSEVDLEAAQHLLFTFVRGIFKKAADLSKANSELEGLTRAKDEFIGMVSHELRTPLGVMIGWIDILKDEGLHDPKQLQALEIIERNARLQINLINDLLDISRIISGKMRLNLEANVDIGRIVGEVIISLQPTALLRDIKITYDTVEPSPMSADPERLRQIIWNLLSNAIKFTPKGGRIEARVIRVASAYELSIADTGVGIPSDQLHRIFNRFSQAQETDAKIGGLGLGLSIVRALVELHGGQIQAYSGGPGLGSTFKVIIPIFALRGDVAFENRPAKDLRLSEVRVLVAEDQPEAALALKHTLEKMGARVMIAASGRDAFELLKSQPFDLLLSDIGMPDGDGYELIARWRSLERERQSAPLPALALTAYATAKDRTQCLEAGFQNHVPKPVDRQELMAVIQALGLARAPTSIPTR